MDTASDKALQRFAELMIEKIKQVEDNWQKPWFGIKGGGLPQNIEGRTYNGVNSFMLFLLSEKEQYSLPVYMTFMQAKDNGLNILKGEKSFPVIYWNFSVRDKNGKKIPFDVYKNLDKNEQQEYKVTPFLKTYNVFNVQQTNLQETKPEKWEALKEQFKIPAIKDEQGMLTVPLIDAMVREQQWICPIYSKEGNSAYHARGEDNHIVVPLKGQFKDGENFYSTLLHEIAQAAVAHSDNILPFAFLVSGLHLRLSHREESSYVQCHLIRSRHARRSPGLSLRLRRDAAGRPRCFRPAQRS